METKTKLLDWTVFWGYMFGFGCASLSFIGLDLMVARGAISGPSKAMALVPLSMVLGSLGLMVCLGILRIFARRRFARQRYQRAVA